MAGTGISKRVGVQAPQGNGCPPGVARKTAGRKNQISTIQNRIKSTPMASLPGAAQQELYPHEFLLHITRGLPVQQCRHEVDSTGERILITEDVYADLPTRIAAANSCARYFAVALAAKQVSTEEKGDVSTALMSIARALPV
jgi:hypothetical protein